MALFCIFWWQQKISHSLGKIFKCNWKILLSKHDNLANDPIFWTLSVGTFHSWILRSSKFSSMFWSVKSTVSHAKDDNFKLFMKAQTRNLYA